MVNVREGWLERLRLPVIAAPMFLVSNLALTRACCRGGIVGGFPAANARTLTELEAWFDVLEADQAEDLSAGPFAVNLTLVGNVAESPMGALVLRRQPPILISSVGDPSEMVRRVHDWGGLIIHDVTTVRHAEKAAEAGVDGVILVCAGAGGHAGAVSPFALLPQVRERFGGLVVLAGAVSDGRSVLAAQALGADLAYMGTRFIATQESMASAAYKAAILEAQTKDIVYTAAISGLPASFIRQSIEAVGLDPANLPSPLGLHRPDLPENVRAWRDVWSAGQGAGLVRDVPSARHLIDRLAQEYEAARKELVAHLSDRAARPPDQLPAGVSIAAK